MDLQTRVKAILMTPASEWLVIAREPADTNSLVFGYAAPLAAIPAVCRFLGMSMVGISVPFLGTIRIGVVRGLSSSIVSWVLTLVGVYIAAVVVEKLAPTFQSKGNTTQALKLVVFAYTPVWIAGVLNLVPALGVLVVIAALYAIYLFYLGLSPIMSTPADKVISYMVVSALVIICLTFILGLVTAAVAGAGGMGLA